MSNEIRFKTILNGVVYEVTVPRDDYRDVAMLYQKPPNLPPDINRSSPPITVKIRNR